MTFRTPPAWRAGSTPRASPHHSRSTSDSWSRAAGTSSAYQVVKSYPGTPDSIIVGTSGKKGERFTVVAASGRSLPALTCGTLANGTLNMSMDGAPIADLANALGVSAEDILADIEEATARVLERLLELFQGLGRESFGANCTQAEAAALGARFDPRHHVRAQPKGAGGGVAGLEALIVHAAFRLRGSSLTGYVVIVLSVASIDRLVRAFWGAWPRRAVEVRGEEVRLTEGRYASMRGVKGFWRNSTPASSTPCCEIAFSV